MNAVKENCQRNEILYFDQTRLQEFQVMGGERYNLLIAGKGSTFIWIILWPGGNGQIMVMSCHGNDIKIYIFIRQLMNFLIEYWF